MPQTSELCEKDEPPSSLCGILEAEEEPPGSLRAGALQHPLSFPTPTILPFPLHHRRTVIRGPLDDFALTGASGGSGRTVNGICGDPIRCDCGFPQGFSLS